jgi:hypothetical protein
MTRVRKQVRRNDPLPTPRSKGNLPFITESDLDMAQSARGCAMIAAAPSPTVIHHPGFDLAGFVPKCATAGWAVPAISGPKTQDDPPRLPRVESRR